MGRHLRSIREPIKGNFAEPPGQATQESPLLCKTASAGKAELSYRRRGEEKSWGIEINFGSEQK
jgi:hypothetical protein